LSGSRVWSADAANAGEALVTNIAGGRETASKDARVSVFNSVGFIKVLLEISRGRNSATPSRNVLLHSDSDIRAFGRLGTHNVIRTPP
jgi:hypothetical protein